MGYLKRNFCAGTFLTNHGHFTNRSSNFPEIFQSEHGYFVKARCVRVCVNGAGDNCVASILVYNSWRNLFYSAVWWEFVLANDNLHDHTTDKISHTQNSDTIEDVARLLILRIWKFKKFRKMLLVYAFFKISAR